MSIKRILVIAGAVLIAGFIGWTTWIFYGGCKSWDLELLRDYQLVSTRLILTNDVNSFIQLTLVMNSVISPGCKRALAEQTRRTSGSRIQAHGINYSHEAIRATVEHDLANEGIFMTR